MRENLPPTLTHNLNYENFWGYPDEPEPITPTFGQRQGLLLETATNSLINQSQTLVDFAIKSTRIYHELCLNLSQIPLISDLVVKNNPWILFDGEKVEEKWLNQQRNLLFPEIIVEYLEKIRPGEKENWTNALNNILDDAYGNNPRMFINGILTGVGIAIVQNGEKVYNTLGLPFPTELTIFSQALITLLGQSVRWKASETGWNIEAAKDTLGRSLNEQLNSVAIPLQFKDLNWPQLLNQIVVDYKYSETDERFKANLNGTAIGLLAGNLLFGNVTDALKYSLATLMLNSTLNEGYPRLIKPLIDKFSTIQNDRRAKIDNATLLRTAKGEHLVGSLQDAHDLELERRRLATTKNTVQGLLSNFGPYAFVIPLMTSISRLTSEPISAKGEAFTWTSIVSMIMERTSQIMSKEDAHNQAQKAQESLTLALQALFRDPERRPPLPTDRPDSPNKIEVWEKTHPLTFKSIGMPTYINNHGKEITRIELNQPVTLNQGEILLIIGGIHSGKTTLLDILKGRQNGHPHHSSIMLGNINLGKVKRELLNQYILDIPIENQSKFWTRSTLAKIIANYPTILGNFSESEINSFINPPTQTSLAKHPIVLAFLQYCRVNNILQGPSGIKSEWFTVDNFRPSGSQQALFNLAAYLSIDGSRDPKIILTEDPSNTLDFAGKLEWRKFVSSRLPTSGHRIIATANDMYTEEDRHGWLSIPILKGIIDLDSSRSITFQFDELQRFLSYAKHKSEPELLSTTVKEFEQKWLPQLRNLPNKNIRYQFINNIYIHTIGMAVDEIYNMCIKDPEISIEDFDISLIDTLVSKLVQAISPDKPFLKTINIDHAQKSTSMAEAISSLHKLEILIKESPHKKMKQMWSRVIRNGYQVTECLINRADQIINSLRSASGPDNWAKEISDSFSLYCAVTDIQLTNDLITTILTSLRHHTLSVNANNALNLLTSLPDQSDLSKTTLFDHLLTIMPDLNKKMLGAIRASQMDKALS